ncbi:alcohol dehydrogenase catalytic domain-containing protein, partial [Bacteroidota bacterium]
MLAAVFKKPRTIDLLDYTLRKLSNDELLLEVGYCGVCGTDRHIYSGDAYANSPVILGHEYAGTIVEKGKEVTKFSIGDRVAVNPNIHCGSCSYCKRGKINLCENLKALGVDHDGGFAQLSIIPTNQAYHLPNDFPLNAAVFSEPVSCCIRGIEQANIKMGDSVVIVGGGSIGLIMLQLSLISGCSKLILIEPSIEKQNIALELGADFAFSPDDHELEKTISGITSGGPDVVIECAGSPGAVKLALQLPKKGGSVVVFGLTGKNDTININLQYLFKNELTIKSSFLNPFTF